MTHIVDSQSLLGTPNELDIFSTPTTQISVTSGHWERVRPQNALDSHGPWTMEVDSGGMFCHPARNYLYMKFQIIRTDAVGTPTAIGDEIAPINLLASTFFKTVKLYIGGKQISDSYDLYPYRAILETMLNYSENSQESSFLKAGLFCPQFTPGHAEDTANKGFQWRKKWFTGSKEVELMSPIHCDLFATGLILPSHTKLRLELYRNSDAFCLLNYNVDANRGRTYQLRLVELDWRVKMLELSKSAALGLEQTLLSSPAKYPIRLTRMSRISVAQGSLRTPQSTLFNGQIPRRIVFGCVDRASFNGDFHKDPFLFGNYEMSEVSVTIGGLRFPRDPLKMDFTQNNTFFRAYLQLLDSMGMGTPHNASCNISPEYFKEGMTLMSFDLSSDESDGSYWDLARSGPTCLEIRFASPLPHDIEIVVYSEEDSLIRVDHTREAHLAHMI